MAWEAPGYKLTGQEAAADLSGNLHYAVELDGNGQVAVSDGSNPIGFLRNKPQAQGHAAEVTVTGVSKAIAAGTVNPGDVLAVQGDGRVGAAGSGDTAIGVCLHGGAADDVVTVLIVRLGDQ